LNTSVVAAVLSGCGEDVVVVAALVVAAAAVVVAARATVVETVVVVGGAALGPVASGSVVAGSATNLADAAPTHPSSASEISSKPRRSTDSR
jgi:hypothetical protein